MPSKEKRLSAYERHRLELASEYAQLCERLEQCRASFDLVTEAELIDALIYEENAILSRMAALNKQAKESGCYALIHEQQNKNKLRT